MNQQHPVNLNLFTIKFPITAIVSILHRVSGVVIFIYLPFLMYALQASLESASRFKGWQECLASPVSRFFVWVFLSAVIYHVFAGIRHLLMDLHIGDSKQGGRITAWLMLSISVISISCLGYCLWQA